jgi:hypothetical protein
MRVLVIKKEVKIKYFSVSSVTMKDFIEIRNSILLLVPRVF